MNAYKAIFDRPALNMPNIIFRVFAIEQGSGLFLISFTPIRLLREFLYWSKYVIESLHRTRVIYDLSVKVKTVIILLALYSFMRWLYHS